MNENFFFRFLTNHRAGADDYMNRFITEHVDGFDLDYWQRTKTLL